jgi:hypothetical protein
LEQYVLTPSSTILRKSRLRLLTFACVQSCGYAVPFYTFKTHRTQLVKMASVKESADRVAEATSPSTPRLPEKGLKRYWAEKNAKSLDGLPGILSAHQSTKPFIAEDVVYKADDFGTRKTLALGTLVDTKLLAGFSLGFLAAVVYVQLA